MSQKRKSNKTATQPWNVPPPTPNPPIYAGQWPTSRHSVFTGVLLIDNHLDTTRIMRYTREAVLFEAPYTVAHSINCNFGIKWWKVDAQIISKRTYKGSSPIVPVAFYLSNVKCWRFTTCKVFQIKVIRIVKNILVVRAIAWALL